MFFSYFKLYRVDVALISFFAYIFGSILAGKLNLINVIIAMLVSLISVNFIYSYNSYTDWKIDKINKPNRAIPKGLITPKSAFNFSKILGVSSVIYPFFITKSISSLFLFLMLPILGILYSYERIRLKKYFFFAVLTTSLIHIIPIILGYTLNTSSNLQYPFFIALFLFCMSVIPLKDIEDVKGDVKHKIENWSDKFGQNKLINFSIISLIVSLIFSLILVNTLKTKVYIVTLIIGILFVFLFNKLLNWNIKHIYKKILLFIIVQGAVFLGILILIWN